MRRKINHELIKMWKKEEAAEVHHSKTISDFSS